MWIRVVVRQLLFFLYSIQNLHISRIFTIFALATDRGALWLRLYPLNLEQIMLFRKGIEAFSFALFLLVHFFMSKSFFSIPLFFVCATVFAQQDTLTIIGSDIQEVNVVARVEQPTNTHTELSDRELNLQNTGQNLPYLLSLTPSLVVTSDDGLGIGYTYFRVRGTDQSRINMTINDIPLNDAESQTVFWVNMTDMASSMNSINVQRGVGTSTNGIAAFGASVNMSTERAISDVQNDDKTHFELGFNGGMYMTFREYLKADVNLGNHWRFNGRFSKVNSDGYLERAKSDLYSYHGSIGYYTYRTKVNLTVFGGREKTYMAWDGVSWKKMQENPRYNPAGKYKDDEGNTVFYPNQNDYYQQQHAQLHLSQVAIPKLSIDATLHYTHGDGYYEQYKAEKKYSSFGLTPTYYINEEGKKKENVTDFVREKHLNNHFFGGVVSLKYISEPADAQFGMATNYYTGQHWGNITYLRDSLYTHPLPYDYEYYRSVGKKLDANLFAKANWRVINRAQEQLTLYADFQYRFVHYKIAGINDEDLQPIPVDEEFHFFNPKAGLTYRNRGHLTYFNFAIANREPSRKNYTEAGVNDIPRPERLYDYELGYNYAAQGWHLGVNLYAMNYKNQLVLTGKYSDTGAYLTRNVDKSYRIGAELMAGVSMLDWFRWNVTLTVSRNKILDYVDWIEVDDAEGHYIRQDETHFGEVTMAFAPMLTASNVFTFDYKGFRADLQTSVVTKQYLDNTMSEEAVLPTYTVTNLNLQYLLPLPERWPDITLRCQLNNLFNTRYASNGGNWMCKYEDGSTYYSPWYYPQAGINVHAGFTMRF